MNYAHSARRLFLSFALLLMSLASGEAAPLWTQIDVLRNGVDGLTGLNGVYDLVISGDGKFAYTAAYNSSAVSVFARDVLTGALNQQQVLTNNVAGVSGIGATRALRLSPDGKFLYAAGTTDNAIAIFSRDATSGALTYLSSYSNGGALNGLSGVNAMNISRDGKFVYASSETNHSLSTFSRDAATGAIAFVETLKDGVGSTSTLNTIRSFTITDDDRFLYAPARDDNDLTQYARDPVTGKLTVAQSLPGTPNYNGPTHISFSPDGLHAYVTSQFGDSLTLFDVDSITGNLTYKTAYFDGFGFLNHAEDIVITADGQFVMVSATIDNAMTIYLRDAVTGQLTLHQMFHDNVAGIDGLFRVREMFLSPDQNFLYVMSPEEHTISIFAVPEPATLGLAGLGMVGLLLAARRRRKRDSQAYRPGIDSPETRSAKVWRRRTKCACPSCTSTSAANGLLL